MPASYRGWIPTVTGRLSFSIVGDTKTPTRAVTANVASDKSRYIICYQKRILIDSILPFKTLLTRLFFGYRGVFRFLCIAKCSNDPTNSSDAMEGYLFIFGGKQNWKGDVENKVKSAQSILNKYPGPQSEPLDRYFKDSYSRLPGLLKKQSSFWAEFSLSRDGVAELTVPDNIEDETHPDSPRFPVNIDLRKHQVGQVTSQLYFFLKDISHIHQHHNPSMDTMVDLYEYDGNDYKWRCETMRVLQRRILQFKRILSLDVYKSSIGILAYAKAFDDISKGSGKKIEPKWLYNHLELSINAAQEKFRVGLEEKIRNADIKRNWMLGTIGIVISMTSLISLTSAHKIENSQVSPILTWLAEILLIYPLQSLAGGYVFYFLINVLSGNAEISNSSPLKNIIRLFQPFREIITFSLLLFLSLVCISLAVYITWVTMN